MIMILMIMMIMFLLQGYDDRIIQGVVGRIDCQELCLIETEFACASAE